MSAGAVDSPRSYCNHLQYYTTCKKSFLELTMYHDVLEYKEHSGTFGQSKEWKLRPTSADPFILPDDIRSLLTEDQINKFKRRKRKFNPWK